MDHALPLSAYQLSENVVIVPFIKSFFGSPASGDWKYSIALPDVRLASAELYMTNALGAGAITVNLYTGTIDSGLRTLAGGQYSFQITGYLAIQTNAAPAVIVDADRSVRDIYGIVGTAPTGAAIVLQINRNGASYVTVQIPAGRDDLQCRRWFRTARSARRRSPEPQYHRRRNNRSRQRSDACDAPMIFGPAGFQRASAKAFRSRRGGLRANRTRFR